MQKVLLDSAVLEWGSASFFCKGPDSKYFRFCGPHGLYLSCSALLVYCESSHRQYLTRWTWLSFGKTSFAKTGMFADPCFRESDWPISLFMSAHGLLVEWPYNLPSKLNKILIINLRVKVGAVNNSARAVGITRKCPGQTRNVHHPGYQSSYEVVAFVVGSYLVQETVEKQTKLFLQQALWVSHFSLKWVFIWEAPWGLARPVHSK